MKNKYQALALILIVVGVAAFISNWFTGASLRDWYPSLIKPSWIPPAWVFGPIWILLYLLMACAMWLVWQMRPAQDAYFWFGALLGLNVLWCYLFFQMQVPFLALVIIGFLWWAIVMAMIAFWKYSRIATLLLIPFMIWVTFAIALNLSILTMQSFLRAANQF